MLERVVRMASKYLAKLVINVYAYAFVRLSLEELKLLEGRNYAFQFAKYNLCT